MERDLQRLNLKGVCLRRRENVDVTARLNRLSNDAFGVVVALDKIKRNLCPLQSGYLAIEKQPN